MNNSKEIKVETDYQINEKITRNDIMSLYQKGESLTGKPIDYDIMAKTIIIDLGNGIIADMPFQETCIEDLKYIKNTLPEQVYQLMKKDVVRCKVLDIKGRRIILSRKKHLKKYKEEILKRFKDNPQIIYEAIVTNTEHFGIFCDIGEGIYAMVPVEEISSTRMSAKDWLKIGTRITVKIYGINDRGQIKCSRKQADTNRYENLRPGTKVYVRLGKPVTENGKITGFFTEISPKITGIADINDYTRNKKTLKSGDIRKAYVRSVDPQKGKVKLYII